jgi:hypothetical protein
MVTYTTHDIDAAYAAISTSPLAQSLSKPMVVDGPPYHGGRVFTFLGPDQERFEICESLWT